MKKRHLLPTLAAALLLMGCTTTNGTQDPTGSSFDITDNNNHDVDLTDDVITDSDDNELDNVETPVEEIEVPEEFDDVKEEVVDEKKSVTISAAGDYYLQGDYSFINIDAKKGYRTQHLS